MSRLKDGDYEGWLARFGVKEGSPEGFEGFDEDVPDAPDERGYVSSEQGKSIVQLAWLFLRLTSALGRSDGSARRAAPEFDLFSIPEDSLAWQVIFVPDGRWRVDYVSRVRSVLRAMLDAADSHPEPILQVNSSKNRDLHELSSLERSRIGVGEVRDFLGVDSPGTPIRDATSLRSRQRMTERLCAQDLASATVRKWLDSVVDLGAVEDHRGQVPPLWPGSARDWPPPAVLTFGAALIDTTGLPPGADSRVREAVLRRRATATMGSFIGTAEHMVRPRRHLAHEVLPTWLPGGVPDTRSDAAKLHPVDPGRDDREWFAAIAMLGFGDALVAARTPAMRRALLDEALAISIHGPTGRSSSLSAEVAQAAGLRKRVKAIAFQEQSSAKLPAIVAKCSPDVQMLFAWANITRQVPTSETFHVYRVARERMRSHYPTLENEMRVVQFADFLIDLAVAPAKMRASLEPDLLQALASFAPESTQRLNAQRQALARVAGADLEHGLSAYDAAHVRNRAIAVQKSDPHLAIRLLRGERQRLSGAKADLDEREWAEMDEQLSLLLAGSYIQRVEDALCLPSSELAGVNADRLGALADAAIDLALRAVAAFAKIEKATQRARSEKDDDIPVFARPRFEDNFLSEATWFYRAYDILYRCLNAAAILAAVRDPASLRHREMASALTEIYRAIVLLPSPIPAAELPRFVQSAITHSFLRRNTLPVLLESGVNPLIEKLNFFAEAPKRVPSDHGDLSTGPNVIEAMSGYLRGAGWDAGLIGKIPPGSMVWAALDDISDGAFGRWRGVWDPFEQLVAAESAEPPSIFQLQLGVFGKLKT